MTFDEKSLIEKKFVNDKWIIPFIINNDKLGFCNYIVKGSLKKNKNGIETLELITNDIISYTKDKEIPSSIRTFLYNGLLELYIQLGLRLSLK